MWSSTGAPIRSSRLIVEQVWTRNAYPDFNYLIASSKSGNALALIHLLISNT